MTRIIFFFLIFLLEGVTHAQMLGIPDVEYYNRRQYGGATQNWQVSQSFNGLVYVANNKGLLEFNGKHWKRHGSFMTGSVRSVKCIGERVYTGAHNDFGYFEYDSLQQFRYISLATADSLRSLGDVWNIYQWNDRVVFHTNSALVIVKDDLVESVVPNLSRFVSCFLANQMLIIYDEENGLLELRGEQIFPMSDGQFFAGKFVTSIIPLTANKLLVGTMNEGAFIWDINGVERWVTPSNKLLKEANIYCASSYNNILLIFGTIQKGIIVTDTSGNLLHQIGKDKGLMNNTVLGLYVDKQGGVWCGLDNGIARISLDSNISFLTSYYDIGTCYAQEKYNEEWYFGTNQGLYKISNGDFYDPQKNKDDFKKIIGTEGQVWSLYTDDNSLLCGHNLGIYKIDGGQSQLITPLSVKGVWKFLPIPGESERMICGTYEGLILLVKENGQWKFHTEISGFDKQSRFIELDREGYIWIADGYNTVYRLGFNKDFQTIKEIVSFGPDFFDNSSSVKVTKIDQQVVIVGDAGLYYRNEKGRISKYERFDSYFLDNEYPSLVQEDENKNLWLFYDEHVEMLKYVDANKYKTVKLPFIPLKNKLVSSFESVFVGEKSDVFFGVEDGLAHCNFDSNTNLRMPFKVHITSFKGRGDSLVYTYLQDNETNNTSQSRMRSYTYNNNVFEVEYAAAYYGDSNIEYATYLSSLDTSFNDWSTETKRQFSKLREGEYIFTVKARNSYGIESEPHTIKFRVLPPWYRSIHAKVAYVVLCIIIFYIIVRVINKRIEVNRQKEKLIAKKHYKKKEELLTNEALKAEKEVIKMRNEKLRGEMQFKEKELASLTVHIVQKNDLLTELQGQLKRIKRIKGQDESERKIESLIQKIGKDIDNESNWQMFERQFEQVHQTFINKLELYHPGLTDKEKKLCAYIKMGMASKEIASLMNVSPGAVDNNRYKLRQKLGLKTGDDLPLYINSIN